jgi:hypothetical protein
MAKRIDLEELKREAEEQIDNAEHAGYSFAPGLTVDAVTLRDLITELEQTRADLAVAQFNRESDKLAIQTLMVERNQAHRALAAAEDLTASVREEMRLAEGREKPDTGLLHEPFTESNLLAIEGWLEIRGNRCPQFAFVKLYCLVAQVRMLKQQLATAEERAEKAEQAFALQPTTLQAESFRENVRSAFIRAGLEATAELKQVKSDCDVLAARLAEVERERKGELATLWRERYERSQETIDEYQRRLDTERGRVEALEQIRDTQVELLTIKMAEIRQLCEMVKKLEQKLEQAEQRLAEVEKAEREHFKGELGIVELELVRWKETARQYAKNADYWRGRAETDHDSWMQRANAAERRLAESQKKVEWIFRNFWMRLQDEPNHPWLHNGDVCILQCDQSECYRQASDIMTCGRVRAALTDTATKEDDK